jgi:hypothetical protein
LSREDSSPSLCKQKLFNGGQLALEVSYFLSVRKDFKNPPADLCGFSQLPPNVQNMNSIFTRGQVLINPGSLLGAAVPLLYTHVPLPPASLSCEADRVGILLLLDQMEVH